MTDTSGEINLQSKQDIISQVAEVKPATSAHYVADVIPFLARYLRNTTFFIIIYIFIILQFALFIQVSFSSLSYHSFYPSKTAVRGVESL